MGFTIWGSGKPYDPSQGLRVSVRDRGAIHFHHPAGGTLTLDGGPGANLLLDYELVGSLPPRVAQHCTSNFVLILAKMFDLEAACERNDDEIQIYLLTPMKRF